MGVAGLKLDKRLIGFVLGIVAAVVIWMLPLDGLPDEGKKCLALTIMTVIFWACQVAQAGFVSGILLALMVIWKVAEPAVVFKSWTGSTMWLVVGAYLIANAVKTSGLGERIAYSYMLRFVKDYRSIIVGIFVLTLVLSLLIPHPWPRAFLIMSIMGIIIKSSGIPKEDAVKIGFAVFAASVPLSLVFLTGDSVINPLAVANSGAEVSFIDWLLYMGPPSLVAGLLTCVLFLMLFRPAREIEVNKQEIQAKLTSLGSMSGVEKRTVFWIVLAIVLWLTDSIHGIDIGWITLIIGMLMAMPIIGEVVKAPDWASVPMQVLIFLTAAIAIGVVGGATGMNAWIAQTLFPASAPENIFVLSAFITVISIVLHMVLGSVIAVMGVAVPAILAFTSSMGLNPVVPTFICYMAIAMHYLFPFQHLNVLVGASEDTGGYTQKETLRLGIPLTVVVFVVTIAVMLPWWMLIGLI
ncbi:anion permease [Collinsella sp. AGMB00827]|uniref:Anion permease n=1 Tax=Collinsella ureilytica TaxID=2869515 RepID=A0ABS7MK27_9ACTN|nr:SLC13 family permease [Collinsella urealyticum]MBY4797724.1 anion permease [Collinsella urealyticum]